VKVSKHIVIMGFMAVGKSTVGRLVADQLGLSFVDTDRLIANMEGLTVEEIFDQKGEPYFRKLEHQVLSDVLRGEAAVVSTGGGLPCSDRSIRLISEKSTSFTLLLGVSHIVNRLANDTSRPLARGLTKSQLRKMVKSKLQARQKYYNKADYRLRATDSPDVIASRIIKKLKLHT